ncbi:MAG: treY [Acidimicrobiaceae bacterium]|nr:treY [Acidimicrobiaceae bacterium]
MSLRPGLGATYRLQLAPALGFRDAAAIVPYLADLGIETCYCSPVAEAVLGSTHGYDGTDPTRLRAELGGEEGFAQLVAACEAAGLGLMVDWVPNHLSTASPWWRRLLAEGPGSEMAEVFDVDWSSGLVTLPLLDRPLAEALTAGLLELGERDGEPVLLIGGTDLPLAGGRPRAGEDLVEVIAAQHYRLVDWHDRSDRNYRRFFDIDGLVGVRVELREVFERTHILITELARSGRISALRIDHIDGLREPTAYLDALKEATGLPIVVEKILTGDERLHPEWPVAGTTGYEVIDDLGGALVEPDGLARLVDAARAEGEQEVHALTVSTRRLVAEQSFAGELSRLADRLGVEQASLREPVVHLPRYRTYFDHRGHEADEVEIWESVRAPEQLLHPAALESALGVQQITGAVMAKGVEDTAWYRLAGALAFCEVGGDPGRDRHGGVTRLHARAAERSADGRAGLIPGSTHDTKRSSDVRARLYALSEVAEAFEAGLVRFREVVDLPEFESRLLAQVLLAVAPATGPGDLLERVGAALEKGAREAKLASSWADPDEEYEASLRSAAERGLAALEDCFGGLVGEIDRLGRVNSLSAVLLRSVLPGVPDCYQGDEDWDRSLVDPDNRREADFERLSDALCHPGPKMAVTAGCLRARRAVPGAFAPGAEYLPLRVEGPATESLVSIARHDRAGGWVIGVATRLAGRLPAEEGELPKGDSYADTTLFIPEAAPTEWRDAITGQAVSTGPTGEARLEDVLKTLPVALLVRT